nr:glycoside hydrolase family 31 protein [bacterium]
MENNVIIPMLPGECWWAAIISMGKHMPLNEHSVFEMDLYADQGGNQAAPLLLSNQGRYIWCDQPFRLKVEGGKIAIRDAGAPLDIGEGYGHLRGAYTAAMHAHFPPTGEKMDDTLVASPQYNLWIEMQYNPTQQRTLAYAHELLDLGYPPGVLMIDDYWMDRYGTWSFHSDRFPDPKAMMDELHRLGFSVMLWICPFVTADSPNFRELRRRGLLLKGEDGQPAMVTWWNGVSAILDLTLPDTQAWLTAQLDRLVEEFGVDGFKLDAGDVKYYPMLPEEKRVLQTLAWSDIGARYGLNEFRACWKCGNRALGQRLRDKRHLWGEQGVSSLIPDGILQGLAGYNYICPDMIGGGDDSDFYGPNKLPFDPEIFVRYAQCAAFFPEMQFSLAPWKALPEKEAALCREAALLHHRHAGYILACVHQSAKDGLPAMRSLDFAYPGMGYEGVDDAFLLGEDLLVAPVVTKGQTRRSVQVPPGTWLGDDGQRVTGPCTITVDAPLERLPHWWRQP